MRFIDKSNHEHIPREFIPAIESGVLEGLQAGILAGYPVDDVEVTLKGGSFHEVDSSEQAFKVAAVMALKESLQSAEPVLLEPIMDIEIVSPEEYVGDIISDLNARRGRVIGFEENRHSKIIKGEVPLAETFGYATALRSASQAEPVFPCRSRTMRRCPHPKLGKSWLGRYGIPLQDM